MLAREPERAVPVDITNLDGSQLYRVPIIVQAVDRPGLLADVTGVISKLKINMVKVGTITNPTRHTATITAVLELQRADQLDLVLRHVQGVKSVLSVERKHSGKAAAEPEPKRPAKKGGEIGVLTPRPSLHGTRPPVRPCGRWDQPKRRAAG